MPISEMGVGNSRIILGKFGFAIDSSDFLSNSLTLPSFFTLDLSTHGRQH